QVLNLGQQLGVLQFDLVVFQAGEPVELQFQDGVYLAVREGVEAVDQARIAADKNAPGFDLGAGPLEGQQFDLRFLARAGTADDADEFVEIAQSAKVAFEDFGAFFGSAQFETGAAQNHFAPVLDISLDQFFEVKRFRFAVIDSQGVDGKGDLH